MREDKAWHGRGHPFPRRGDHHHAPFGQERLTKFINEAFVGRHDADKVLNQLIQELKVVRARGQWIKCRDRGKQTCPRL